MNLLLNSVLICRSKINLDGKRINHPLKRFRICDLLDHPNEKDKQVVLKSIPHISTDKGIQCDYLKYLDISKDGRILIGIHFTNNPKCRVIKYDFDNHQSSLFDHEHGKLALCVKLIEDRNLVMSGGRDKKLVSYDYETGKIKNVFSLGIGGIGCISHLGAGVVCVEGYDTLKFINGESSEVIQTDNVKPDCSSVYFMESVLSDSSSITMLMGGSKSGKLSKLKVPENVSRIGKGV